MLYILDRIEGETAVLEQSEGAQICYRQIAAKCLPAACKEGDVLCCHRGVWRVDETATQQRRRAIQAQLQALLQGNAGGK